MSQIHLLSNINFSQLPQLFSATVKRIDWKVGACVGVALAALAYLAIRNRRPTQSTGIFTNRMEPRLETLLDIKNATYANLGFTEAEQEITCTLPNYLTHDTNDFTLKNICEDLILLIKNRIQTGDKTEITFDTHNQGDHLFDHMNFGLPNNLTYQDAGVVQKKQSWNHRILQALKDKGYIRQFIIMPDGDRKIVITL